MKVLDFVKCKDEKQKDLFGIVFDVDDSVTPWPTPMFRLLRIKEGEVVLEWHPRENFEIKITNR